MRGNKLGGQRRQDEVDFYLNHKIRDDHKNNHQRSTSPYGLFAEEVGHCMLPYIRVQILELVLYNGKFSNGANFRIFRMLAPYSK